VRALFKATCTSTSSGSTALTRVGSGGASRRGVSPQSPSSGRRSSSDRTPSAARRVIDACAARATKRADAAGA
jgi:hypothetical protein